MNTLTVTEIMKTTGKSQSTILRFIKTLKEEKPESVLLEEVGQTRQYKVDEAEVQRHFVTTKQVTKEQQTPQAHQSTPSIPEGYKLIPNETIQALQQQLIAKDEQIRRLQENNHVLSGAITSMKMLGTGKPQKKKEETNDTSVIIAQNTPKDAPEEEGAQLPAKERKRPARGRKQPRTIEKTKPSKKRGLLQRIFGIK